MRVPNSLGPEPLVIGYAMSKAAQLNLIDDDGELVLNTDTNRARMRGLLKSASDCVRDALPLLELTDVTDTNVDTSDWTADDSVAIRRVLWHLLQSGPNLCWDPNSLPQCKHGLFRSTEELRKQDPTGNQDGDGKSSACCAQDSSMGE